MVLNAETPIGPKVAPKKTRTERWLYIKWKHLLKKVTISPKELENYKKDLKSYLESKENTNYKIE